MDEFKHYLLFNYIDDKEIEGNELVENVWNCEWNSKLSSDLVKSILKNDQIEDNTNIKDALLTGMTSLLLFIQNNFTGPTIQFDELSPLFERTTILEHLKVDSEELDSNVLNPELLYISKIIFNHLSSCELFVAEIWKIRFLITYQKVLDEHANSIYEEFNMLCDKIGKDIESETIDTELKTLIMIEVIQGYIHFRRISKADKWFHKLNRFLGIELTTEGALGVRTKYQQKALPQLALAVKMSEDISFKPSNVTHGLIKLPNLLKLEDDLRLERITFCSDVANEIKQYSSLVQNIILTKLLFLTVSQPKDKLADEELQPYITSLLYQDHGPWPTRIMTLFNNIKLESSHKRTVDRSLKQSEDLVNLMNSPETPINQRLSLIFGSGMCPRWEFEAKLGDIMVSLGLIKGALDLYLKIHKWEEVISCYNILDLRHRAAEIIQQEIDKKPSVKLYCLLGDATDDTKCYEKAWEFSKETSAKAQRHWGNYYFAKKEYENALPHLKKSIEINSLQEDTLLRLGYAALQLEMWEDAAKAYRHYTYLESQGFECWNNLAKAYIKLGDKKRAHKVLHESLKCNFNNWMVWENFMNVSVDTGNFEDGWNAYERLLDLKDKYNDEDVLNILVSAIEKEIPDANGKNSVRLAKKGLKILGHASSKMPGNGFLFELASKLADDPLHKAQKMQNAYRAYSQSESSWAKNPVSAKKIIKICMGLCEYSLKAAEDDRIENNGVKSQLSSARLTAQGVVRVVRNENWKDLEDCLNDLQNLVDKIFTYFQK